MARLRYNGLTATLGAALAAGDTTISFGAALSSAAGAVSTIAGGDYIPLAILNAGGGVVEIVSLTAYTSGATTGTITRAREGTTAAAHASGASVVHGPSVADWTTPNPLATVQLYLTANTAAVANDTVAAISWTAEKWDTHAFHDLVTNPTRVTIPSGKAGKYLLQGTVQYNSTTGVGQARFHKNGSFITPNGVGSTAASTGGIVATHSTIVDLAAGDYVELCSYQNSGSSQAVVATLSSFTVTLLGA